MIFRGIYTFLTFIHSHTHLISLPYRHANIQELINVVINNVFCSRIDQHSSNECMYQMFSTYRNIWKCLSVTQVNAQKLYINIEMLFVESNFIQERLISRWKSKNTWEITYFLPYHNRTFADMNSMKRASFSDNSLILSSLCWNKCFIQTFSCQRYCHQVTTLSGRHVSNTLNALFGHKKDKKKHFRSVVFILGIQKNKNENIKM